MSKKIDYRDPEKIEDLFMLRDNIMEARSDVDDTELLNDLEAVEKRLVILTGEELRKPPKEATVADDIGDELAELEDLINKMDYKLYQLSQRLDAMEA